MIKRIREYFHYRPFIIKLRYSINEPILKYAKIRGEIYNLHSIKSVPTWYAEGYSYEYDWKVSRLRPEDRLIIDVMEEEVYGFSFNND